MSNLPSFRPRTAMGRLMPNGDVQATQQFLRYLENLARKTDATDATVAAAPFPVVAALGVGFTDSSTPLPLVASSEVESEVFPTVSADTETFTFEVV